MPDTTGYYAVRFHDDEGVVHETRITSKKVDNALQACDDVLGSAYSKQPPMIIDVLHDFSRITVKMIGRTVGEVRSDKKRRERLANPEGWFHPSYPPEQVARARRQLARAHAQKEQ